MYKIVFRFDANGRIGYGHFVRCQALAEQLILNHDIIVKFIMRNEEETPFEVISLNTQYEVIKADDYVYESIENELEEVKEILKSESPDCIIVDSYGASKRYFEEIRPFVKLIAAFDDCNEAYRSFPVDIILNGNCYAKNLDYGSGKRLLLGSDYAILRKDFLHCHKRRIREMVEVITITTGGSDPLNVSVQLIKVLNQMNSFRKVQKNIVIGAGFSKENIRLIEEAVREGECYILQYHADMRKLMDESDLFLTSSGSTLNELAATGTPSISMILSEDQLLVGEVMHNKEITYNVGWFQKIIWETFREQLMRIAGHAELRKRMSENGQRLIDGIGVERAGEQILDAIQKEARE